MRGIILAAGRGSRMGSLTEEKPKCLTEIYGKPLIQHQIDALTSAGINDIAVITGYKSDCLKKYGTHHFHNSKWSETNMVASLLCAREWLEESDCIVSYSDIFYKTQIVKDLISCSDNIVIAYDPNWLALWSKRFENPLDDAETFRIDENGYLLEIGQKAASVEEIQGQYMGLLRFKDSFWKTLEAKKKLNYKNIDTTSFLNSLLKNRYKIKTIPTFDIWGEIDTFSDLLLLEKQ